MEPFKWYAHTSSKLVRSVLMWKNKQDDELFSQPPDIKWLEAPAHIARAIGLSSVRDLELHLFEK